MLVYGLLESGGGCGRVLDRYRHVAHELQLPLEATLETEADQSGDIGAHYVSILTENMAL